jgi:transketolase
MEGRVSHGAGHKLCSEGFRDALAPLLRDRRDDLPSCCDLEEMRCSGPGGRAVMEECFWDALCLVREEIENRREMVECLAGRLVRSKSRLEESERRPREGAPCVEAMYELAEKEGSSIPSDLVLQPGTAATLRGELGKVLNRYNRASHGALLVAAGDLLGSTSVNTIANGFPDGYFNASTNPEGRLLSIGGICEDAISGIMSGLGSFGHHVGVGSSYGAFLAPLGHIASRLHGIGNQARQEHFPGPFRPMILVCAHAGLKTGEDGPTHADPQALQVLQENFPPRIGMTLTPWDPQEMWPLVSAALVARPAVLFPFVTRPNEIVPDREALGLAPATEAARGLYALRRADGKGDGTVVLQGSGVTMDFVNVALPRILEKGIDLNVYYVASAELFDRLPRDERERIFPEERAQEAIGITGFTLPTLYRWVTSSRGRSLSLHPFLKGHFLGSGQADMVLAEAGLDGERQFEAILRYVG